MSMGLLVSSVVVGLNEGSATEVADGARIVSNKCTQPYPASTKGPRPKSRTVHRRPRRALQRPRASTKGPRPKSRTATCQRSITSGAHPPQRRVRDRSRGRGCVLPRSARHSPQRRVRDRSRGRFVCDATAFGCRLPASTKGPRPKSRTGRPGCSPASSPRTSLNEGSATEVADGGCHGHSAATRGAGLNEGSATEVADGSVLTTVVDVDSWPQRRVRDRSRGRRSARGTGASRRRRLNEGSATEVADGCCDRSEPAALRAASTKGPRPKSRTATTTRVNRKKTAAPQRRVRDRSRGRTWAWPRNSTSAETASLNEGSATEVADGKKLVKEEWKFCAPQRRVRDRSRGRPVRPPPVR